MFDLAFLWSDTVIFPVIFFVMGLGATLAYFRIAGSVKERNYHADDAVIQAVVSEYMRRLQEYDRMLADLKVRMDLVELRGEPRQAEPARDMDQISRASHSPQHHTQRVRAHRARARRSAGRTRRRLPDVLSRASHSVTQPERLAVRPTVQRARIPR